MDGPPMSKSDFEVPDKVPPAQGRFTTPPPGWNAKISALWDKAWSRLCQDPLNYTGAELRKEQEDAQYATEFANVTRRR